MRVSVAVARQSVVASVRGSGMRVVVGGLGTQGRPGPASPKAFSLEWPTNGEAVTLFWAPWVVGPEGGRVAIDGDAGSDVTWELRYGPDVAGPGTVLAGGTVGPGSGEDVTLAPAEVPAGSWVWFVVVGVSGVVREIALSLWL